METGANDPIDTFTLVDFSDCLVRLARELPLEAIIGVDAMIKKFNDKYYCEITMACRQIIKYARFAEEGGYFPLYFVSVEGVLYVGYRVQDNYSNRFLYDMFIHANKRVPFYHILQLM